MTVRLGSPVVYHAHSGHHTVIEEQVHDEVNGERVPRFEKKDGKDVPVMQVKHHGSIHHPEQRDFHAHVTRLHYDGSVDLVFFPPNREPRHADRVREGVQPEGDHYFTVDHDDAVDLSPLTSGLADAHNKIAKIQKTLAPKA